MLLSKDEFSLAEEKASTSKKKTLEINERHTDQALMDIRKKEMEKLGLNKPISRSGFIKFNSYYNKALMMDTALFLFGMKLHRHQYSIEFFDADFANTLLIQSNSFTDRTLGECCRKVNEILVRSGF